MHTEPAPVHRRRRTHGLVATLAVIAAGGIAGVLGATAHRAQSAPAPEQTRPSLDPAVVSATVTEGSEPSVSGDGHWVVFEGRVDDGAAVDAGQDDAGAGRATVYRTDRFTGATIELSPLPPGVRGGDTINPVISADGCVVVAQSEVPLDVFRDDDRDERWDVYSLVVPECGGLPGAWELVSVDDTTGTARDDVIADDPASVSGSGAVVAFVHPAPDGPDGLTTITVVDLTLPVGDPNRNQAVRGTPVEAPNTAFSYRGARQPALSANGRHLAFQADFTASETLPGWASGPAPGGPATAQVYVYDRFASADRLGTVRLVSGRDGVATAAGASDPAISEDGRIVVFTSADQGLVTAEYPPCPHGCPTQVFRYDRDTDGNGIFDEPPRTPPLSIVSASRDGIDDRKLPVAGDQSSWSPALNIDGSQVAFVTDATTLVSPRVGGGGDATDGDIVIAEALLGTLHRATESLGLASIPGAHGNPSLSGTGRVVVYDSMVAASITGDATLTGRHVVASPSQPRLSLASADFGTVLVGWESEELYISVLNDGPGAFMPAIVTSSSRSFKITDGGTCRAGVVVPAGSSCTVYLTFNPTAPTVFTGTVRVSEDLFEGVSVATEVRGVGGEPALHTNPPGLDLEVAVVGTTGPRRTVDIENVSFAPTRIGTIRIVGEQASDFRVAGQSCTNRALNPSASCSVEVEFTPQGGGRRSAVLQVLTTTGPYTAAIVAGEGRYQPSVTTVSPEVRAGGVLGLGGTGFPVNSALVLQFGDGGRPFALVSTNEHGEFLAQVEIPPREHGGRRTVDVLGPDSVATSVDIVVTVEHELGPGTPGIPGFGAP